VRRKQRKSDCPIHFALEVFGDAWSLLIVRDLMFKGRTTYSEFLRSEEGIATNILADRLARLEADGIVARASGGRYQLTAKGADLLPILLEIIRWSAQYDRRTAAAPEFVRRLRRDRDGLERELRRALSIARVNASPSAARRGARKRRLHKGGAA
jgi:DNA-binding HxlR family transcriptional regulator